MTGDAAPTLQVHDLILKGADKNAPLDKELKTPQLGGFWEPGPSGFWERVICPAGGTFVYLTLVKSVGFCPVAIHLAASAKHPAGLCNKMDCWCSISWVCFQLEQPQNRLP
jgi:hypothetical protein